MLIALNQKRAISDIYEGMGRSAVRDKREHTRFDVTRIQGTMVLANRVEIVDISLGGICLKTDKPLITDRDYNVKLSNDECNIDVNGNVVRSEIFRMEAGADGEDVLTYMSGMKFDDGSKNKIRDFMGSVEHFEKKEGTSVDERRRHVRFQIASSHESVLVFPVNFRVKDMSLSSMLIISDEPMEKGASVPINLYLDEDNKLDFTGKVFSCRKVKENYRDYFNIEVTYYDLKRKEREIMKEFIAYLISNRIDQEKQEQWGQTPNFYE
jgi:hypothetical protein